jgi:hypothetical protein
VGAAPAPEPGWRPRRDAIGGEGRCQGVP